MAAKKRTTNQRVKRRARKNVESGAVHIRSTFNNTIVTITDKRGNTISWASSGTLGFKGPARARPLLHRWLRKPPPNRRWNTG